MKSLRSLAVIALFVAPACTTFGTASEEDDAGTSPTPTSNPNPPRPIVLPDGAVVVPDAAQPPPGPKDAGSDARGIDAAGSRPCIAQPSFRCIDFQGPKLEVFAGSVPVSPPPTATIVGSPNIAIAGGFLTIGSGATNTIHSWVVLLPTATRTAYSVKVGVVAVTEELELFRLMGSDRTVVVTAQRIMVGGAGAPVATIELPPPYDLVITPDAVTAGGNVIPLGTGYFAGTDVTVGGGTHGRGAGAWSLELGYIRVTN